MNSNPLHGGADRRTFVDPQPAPAHLPAEFTFSQSTLQMYVDCNRRFYLTHIERLPWPAIEAAPFALYEEAMRQGELFHRIVQRGIEGVPIANAPLAPPLDQWVQAWLAWGLKETPTQHRLTERMLATAIVPEGVDEPVRLVAKYDLIAAESGAEGTAQGSRVVIVDWKTSARRPEVEAMRRRWQSLLYPFVLVESALRLPFGDVAPEDVEMRYWFAGAPDAPIRLRYDRQQHEANRAALAALLGEILGKEGEAAFPKVPDTPANRRRFCAFCVYRSRCQRGDEPGVMDEYDEESDAEIGAVDAAVESYALDTISELAF